MRDQPKTLSDICARIRTIDESMMRDLDFIAVFLEFLPRDIEAAAERERQDAMKTALLAKCKVCEKVGPASAPGNAAAMREALKRVESELSTMNQRGWGDKLACVRSALAAPPTPPSDAAKMREAISAIKELNDRRPHDAAGYEINDIIEEALALEKS